ncbi:hypothetical protein E4T56_gene13665 [Termitomyces sp. T112]|nr:hypothetical protein E4T56_gene13665 [Termitomyces sp. T112]
MKQPQDFDLKFGGVLKLVDKEPRVSSAQSRGDWGRNGQANQKKIAKKLATGHIEPGFKPDAIRTYP